MMKQTQMFSTVTSELVGGHELSLWQDATTGQISHLEIESTEFQFTLDYALDHCAIPLGAAYILLNFLLNHLPPQQLL